MAREIRTRKAKIPSGTPISAPVTVDVSFPPRVVQRVDLLVPAGANGLVGFQLANSGGQVIPADAGDWIIANGETIVWPLENQIDSGSWQVIGYNTGIYDHTIYLRFLLALVQSAGAGAQPTVDLALLNQEQTQPEDLTGAAQTSLDNLLTQIEQDGGGGDVTSGGGLFDPAALGPASQLPMSVPRL